MSRNLFVEMQTYYFGSSDWVNLFQWDCHYMVIIAESKFLRIENPGKVSFDVNYMYFDVYYCGVCWWCWCWW